MTEGLIPVLQMDDRAALDAAMEHLSEQGYKAEVGSFSDLTKVEHQDWMTPENGGFIFYLEESKYEAAMTMLDDFFGYVPDEE